MPVVGRLSGLGTFLAYSFDEQSYLGASITGLGTAFAYEFDENVGVANTLTGSTRMRYLPGVGIGTTVVVFDSINEVDPIETTFSTTGLQLHIDPVLSTKVETAPVNQVDYLTAGTFTFTVPPAITSISAVCVGGGGGGGNATITDEPGAGGAGGGLSYGTFAVTPGEALSVQVGSGGQNGGTGGTGGISSISRNGTALLSATGGSGGSSTDSGASGGGNGGSSGGTERDGGGSGGDGGSTSDSTTGAGGGGGAAGYSGNGGAGSNRGANNATAGQGGGGGGGGGGTASLGGGGGGGVGILGSGGNGGAGTNGTGGGGGSGGAPGSTTTVSTGANGGLYGGGGAGGRNNANGGDGQGGAVRIIYGTGRSYPSTSVTDATVVNYSLTLSDLSGNGRTASSVNEAFWSSTIPSTPTATISLDGVDDYMTVASYKGVTGTGARTSIIWFKTSAINLSPRLFGWGNTTTGQKWNMSIDPTTYKATAEIATGSIVGGSTTPDLADSHWHMIAASAPASGTANDIKLYVDGDLLTDVTITSGATAINTASGSDVSFGASLADAAPGYLSGNVSRFLIYNRQLTDFEIKVVYRDILNRFFPS